MRVFFRFQAVILVLAVALPPSNLRGQDGPAASSDQQKTIAAANRKTFESARAAEREHGATTGVRLGVQLGHAGIVNAAAWSPDGTRIATVSVDWTARVWDAPGGREILRLDGHASEVTGVAWSPDSASLATVSKDGTGRVWEMATGREVRLLKGHSKPVIAVAWSPDGTRLVTAGLDRTARIWDAASGLELMCLEGHASSVNAVAWSPDGGRIVTSGGLDRSARVWNATNGQEVLRMGSGSDGVYSAVWSPDGTRILSGSSDGTTWVWNAQTGAEVLKLTGHAEGVYCAAWSPDGKRILTASWDKTARVWNVADGTELVKLTGHSDWVVSGGWSPDGLNIVTAGADATVRLWDARKGTETGRLEGLVGDVNTAAWSPDGTRLATTGGRFDPKLNRWIGSSVRVWDLAEGRDVLRFQEPTGGVGAVAWSPDGARLVIGGSETARVWDVAGARVMTRLDGLPGLVRALSFSPDGTRVAVAAQDRIVSLRDAATGKETGRLTGHSELVNAVAWAPDGKRIATGSNDGTARVWDAATGETLHVLDGNAGYVTSVAWSPDSGRLATSGGYDRTVRVWEVASGQELARLEGHSWAVTGAAWSPDGSRIVTACRDRMAGIWDWRTGRLLQVLAGHAAEVTVAAFHPAGAFVLTGGGDGTIRIWSAATGRERCRLVSFRSDERWAVVDPAGRFDIGDPNDVEELNWIIPEHGRPVPYGIELFFRQYYEPGLLRRILAGESFRPIPSIADLNRAQPMVTIDPHAITPVVEQGKATDLVDIAVSVTPPKNANFSGGDTRAFDLRLFRDGQLVGYRDGELAYADGKRFTKTFRVALPHRPDSKTVEFSAHCFNSGLVRSTRATATFAVPPQPVKKGKAYVITFGVNRYEDAGISPLNFAVADAGAIQAVLPDRLRTGGQFAEVIQIALTSDADTKPTATRSNLKAVLDRLAGRTVESGEGIPNFASLAMATPEDLIVLAFAGHGYRGPDGEFYIVPFDTGREGGLAGILHHSITSDDLSLWLRDVDAGDLTMILDACQSAAVVGEEFKPGPMGSRGLGQLSFDKGMRILAATQADNVAMESGTLKQGFLSFALIVEGLGEGKADFAPRDGIITLGEWLAYGVKRVPRLPADIAAGKIKARLLVRDTVTPLQRPQIPVIFDFARHRRPVTLSGP